MLHAQSKADKFINSLQLSPKSARFYAKHVKSICIESNIELSLEDLFQGLQLFKGMTELMLWCKIQGDLAAHTSLIKSFTNNVKVKSMSMAMEKIGFLPRPDFSHTLFSDITHLIIVDKGWETWGGWSKLNNLTHLGLVTHADEVPLWAVNRILSDCRKLKILLLLVADSTESRIEMEVCIKDPRVIVISTEWATGQERTTRYRREGYSMWAEGEFMIQLATGKIWTGT